MWTLSKRVATLLTIGWHPQAVRLGSRLHKALLRTPLRRLAALRQDVIVLTTRGARSGRETSTPLFYVARDHRLYVAASFAGSDQPPVWYRNLLAQPDVIVTLDGVAHPHHARTLEPAEAARVWPMLHAMYPTFARYRQRTRRVIPVVELTPSAARESATAGAGRPSAKGETR